MLQPIPKEKFLAQLHARNQRNREMVEEIFLPLNEAQRAAPSLLLANGVGINVFSISISLMSF